MFDGVEDVKIFANRDADRLIERVGRFEPHAVGTTAQALNRVRAVKGYDDEEITVEDAGVSHGVAIGPHQEGGRFVVDQEVVEIERRFEVILRWTRKACEYTSIEVRQH